MKDATFRGCQKSDMKLKQPAIFNPDGLLAEESFHAFDGLQSSSTRTLDSIKYIDKQSEVQSEATFDESLRKRLNVPQTISDEDLQLSKQLQNSCRVSSYYFIFLYF